MTSTVIVVGVIPMSDAVSVAPAHLPAAVAAVVAVAAAEEDEALLDEALLDVLELLLELLRVHADATRHTASAPYNHTDFLTGPPVIALPLRAAP